MGQVYIVFGSDKQRCKHFMTEEAEEAVKKISYTSTDGEWHKGAKWTCEEVETLTRGLDFNECVTKGDKYVAFNAFYADTCKVLTPDLIIKTAHAFFFKDEDAPCDKIYRYICSTFS